MRSVPQENSIKKEWKPKKRGARKKVWKKQLHKLKVSKIGEPPMDHDPGGPTGRGKGCSANSLKGAWVFQRNWCLELVVGSLVGGGDHHVQSLSAQN